MSEGVRQGEPGEPGAEIAPVREFPGAVSAPTESGASTEVIWKEISPSRALARVSCKSLKPAPGFWKMHRAAGRLRPVRAAW
jgi:hypothetical protein